jgi:predicted RNase H-like nuclease (RuvC/YqgF family)
VALGHYKRNDLQVNGIFTATEARHLSEEEFGHYMDAGLIELADVSQIIRYLAKAYDVYKERIFELEGELEEANNEIENLTDKLEQLESHAE